MLRDPSENQQFVAPPVLIALYLYGASQRGLNCMIGMKLCFRPHHCRSAVGG